MNYVVSKRVKNASVKEIICDRERFLSFVKETSEDFNYEFNKIPNICSVKQQYGFCLAETANTIEMKCGKENLEYFFKNNCPDFCPNIKKHRGNAGKM